MRRLLRWSLAVVFLAVAAALLPLGLTLAGEDVCRGAAALQAGPRVEILPPRYVCTRAVVETVRGQPLVVDTGQVIYTKRPWGLVTVWAVGFVAALALSVFLVLPTVPAPIRRRGPY